MSRTEGVVLKGTGGVWHVRTESGETHQVSLRGRLKQEREDGRKLAVGDRVALEMDQRGAQWAIAEILPRRSQLARRAPGAGQGERIVAANVDQVVIVFAAARPEPHRRMLDRFLVIAEGNSLQSRIVINKIELVNAVECEKSFADYAAAGYPVHFTSVKQSIGLVGLHDELAGKTSVLTGPSGVGKSSLMNSMYPGLALRVGEISESVNKGQHTTVGALLHPLPDGGYVVDTPGLREVGMWGLASEHLDECFREFRAFIPECRFGNCTHRVEPGCAVRSAVEAGEISAERYDSYLRLREEIEDSERKWAPYSAASKPQRRHS
ncbi:MAG TPA: ribosome small subunit-dependent GTPase A [Gemmatimonadaceae bacterium]|nr:ribosome small subunit-dependent GTPase A [Gemmatimonadaceae bacterium]